MEPSVLKSSLKHSQTFVKPETNNSLSLPPPCSGGAAHSSAERRHAQQDPHTQAFYQHVCCVFLVVWGSIDFVSCDWLCDRLGTRGFCCPCLFGGCLRTKGLGTPKEPDDSGGGGSERGLKGLYEGLHTRLTCMISHTITYGRIRDLPEIGVGGMRNRVFRI